MAAVKAIAILVLLGISIFAVMALMRNIKGGSGSGLIPVVPTPTRATEPITPATPSKSKQNASKTVASQPKLVSRFQNTPKSLGGPPKDSGINFADDFNFKDPNEGKSTFCRVTGLFCP